MRSHVRGLRAATLVCAALAAGGLGGCASDGGGGGSGPPSRPLPNGETCASVKGQLARLDSKGVRGTIQSMAAGNKVSAAAKADADLYNKLLNDYLGARCHVPPSQ